MYREYRCEHLDLIRGCAALLVLAGHLRHFVFKDYVDLQQAGVPVGALARLFYFATSFQHQAVIVFFALSGFLVGGRIFGDICSDRFRWASYLARRLTRLWIVIVPALVLTEVFDALRPDGSPAGNASLVVFVGNLLFVQTILVPPLGNNLPLWSLANEYWYYLLGPVVVLLILGRSFYQFKLLGLAAIIVFCLSFPFSFVVGGIIWMAGALAAWAGRKYSTRPRPALCAAGLGAIVLFAVALLASKFLSLGRVDAHIGSVGATDACLGVAVAVALPLIASLPNIGGWYARLTRASADISYTLYLTHYPLLTFATAQILVSTKLLPDLLAMGVYLVLFVAAIAFAFPIWWCFERNTESVYSYLSRPDRRTVGP